MEFLLVEHGYERSAADPLFLNTFLMFGLGPALARLGPGLGPAWAQLGSQNLFQKHENGSEPDLRPPF